MKKIQIIFLIALLLLPLGMKAAVADSTEFKVSLPLVTRVGASVVINAGLTEVLKSSIEQTRPDGVGTDSWPSRHTSYAFTAASVLSHELYTYSPWWVVGFHAAADAVAMQRVIAEEHFPKDVLGGAVVGLVSTEIGYFLTDLIFPGSRRPLPDVLSDWLPSFDVSSVAAFPLCGGGKVLDGRTALFTSLRMSLPMSDNLGATAALNFRTMPLFMGDVYADMINSAGVSAGIAGYLQFPFKRWSGEMRVMPGLARNLECNALGKASWSFTFDATATTTCRLTDNFAFGIEVGYAFWGMQSNVSALTIGAFTRVVL